MRILLFAIVTLMTLLTPIYGKTPNPYKVLGISRDATEDQIREGFKKRSKKYHPDRNKKDPRAKEKFEKIANAYELLKDPERKRIYDMTGEDDPQGQQFNQQHGFGGGFPGGGFGFEGINIEDLMNQGFFGGGHHGGHQQHGHHGHHDHHGHQGGGRRQRQATYTFSFGGGDGMRFEF